MDCLSGRRAGSAARSRRRSSRFSARAVALANCIGPTRAAVEGVTDCWWPSRDRRCVTPYNEHMRHADALHALDRELRARFGARFRSLVVYGTADAPEGPV